MIQPAIRDNNLVAMTDAFETLRDKAAPLFHLLQSTSFIEGNKIALPELIADVFKKSWGEMNHRERCLHIGKNICSMFSKRFDYLILVCKSSLDFIVATIKAIAATLLKWVIKSQDPAKHWRHTGVALFTIFNSVFGIITPKYANLSQLFFSVTVLGITGRNVKDKINNLIIGVQNRWQQAQQTAAPQP